MRTLLALLGVLGGFAVARALDSAWVIFWYAGDRAVGLPPQPALDAGGLALAGGAGGALGLWIAGRSARGIGLWIGLLLLAATAIDLLVGIANAPWWYEFVTALVMVPTAMLAGGARLQTLRSWGGRRRRRPAAAR